MDRFVGVARGRALRGSRAIAEYLLGDPDASEIVVTLGRDLTGYTGWIDFALAARARAGKGRRRATSAST